MKRFMMKKSVVLAAFVLGAGGVAYAADEPANTDSTLRDIYDNSVRYTQAYDFPQRSHGDPVLGRRQFGLAADSDDIDSSLALISGNSVIAGQIVSNGRTCATCHNAKFNFILPPRPLSESVAADDPLLTGENADAQGDPRMKDLFENHALVRHRFNRFNPLIPADSPVRKVFMWRKVQTIINFGLGFGALNEGRARSSVDVVRGATFTHTQDGDARFDDLVTDALFANIGSFQENVFFPPELKGMVDPSDPLHDTLLSDPFYTVHPTTDVERMGQDVFQKKCMDCHNMPNSFGNRDHVAGSPANFPPLYGHTMDIGVAQANRMHLDFRLLHDDGTYETLVVPLTREDGKLVNVTVVDDLGAAGATARYEDLHKFKIPQLRKIKDLAPYFHDASANTLEEVVDYFNSDQYNNSADGKKHPIHVDDAERTALLAFLRIL